MNLNKKNGSGVTGAWVGSLEDSSVYSVLTGDLVHVGGCVVGGWEERRESDEEVKGFRSSLSGSFNDRVLSLIETRSDQSVFKVRLTLSPDGKKLSGKWKTQPGKRWWPIRLHRYEGNGISQETKLDQKFPVPQS